MDAIRNANICVIMLVAAVALSLSAGCGDEPSEPREIQALPTATSQAEATGVGALPLDRFAYQASLTLREGGGEDARELFVSTQGVYVSPDSHSFTYRTQLGQGEAKQDLVIVGDSVWYREGDDPWEKVPIDSERVTDLLAVAFSALKPNFLGGQEFERVRANVITLPSAEEFVNETRTYHYEVGPEGRQYLDTLDVGDEGLRAAQDLAWDLWLARDGSWPVRLQATGTVAVDLTVLETLELEAPTQWEILIDISRPNDPTLEVEPPGEA